ncbi:MAG: cardiolipin synthase B [Acidobacteria bacterium]|nr:cardiolipin synthase B [Acidobacteriota bacterium]
MTLSILAVLILVWFVLVLFFTPRIDYRVSTPLRPDSDQFLHVIQASCQASLHYQNRVEILTDGTQFYPAMRDAILTATSSINLEAYIFQPGQAADMLIDAMIARAREGVTVRLVLDAIGSANMRGKPVERLHDAGCNVQFYQRLRWYRLHRINNRTHRELLIVDGRVAFAGGAGVADWWYVPIGKEPAWRDTMARIEGPVVTALQGVFAENWLECGGEIITSPGDWPRLEPAGATEAMLVKSSPSDRATTSRVFFQMLIDGSVSSVDISTPYLLPDRALRQSLVKAARRGVVVRVIVPGVVTDQRLVRLTSRRLYGELLEGGVRIHEYRPAMTHVKALMVDRLWAVIGTTNIDNRSFEHNDEVNVAFRDRDVTACLNRDFQSDLAASDEITLDAWRERSRVEKALGLVSWILERQQ